MFATFQVFCTMVYQICDYVIPKNYVWKMNLKNSRNGKLEKGELGNWKNRNLKICKIEK